MLAIQWFGVLAVLVALMSPPAVAQQRQVTVEPKPRQISAGGGKPFDVTRHSIPLNEIQGGGPPRDGIPALTRPEFVSSQDADRHLHPDDMVLGLEFGAASKAYPIRILNWHEVVNDDVGNQPVAVTW